MKLHPLSAVTRSLQRGLLAASFVFFAFGMANVAFSGAGDRTGLILALLPVAFLAGVAYQVAYYYRFEYELTPDTLDIDSGVFGRQEREIPYRRVQNVDITESIVHRILGVAVVRVETAGGSETEAELDFVAADEARRLQGEIRERRAAAQGETRTGTDAEDETADRPDGVADDAVDAGETPVREHGPRVDAGSSTPIFSLGSGELLALSAASFRSASIFLLVVGFPFVQDFVVGTAVRVTGVDLGPGAVTSTPDIALVAGLIAIFLAVLTSWVLSAVATFTEYYNFTLGRQGEDLVYERGLLQRYSGSIPTDKIQTLTIKENLLMRALGYAGLSVETAGYSPGQQNGQGGPQAAIPLAGRERTLSLARDLEAFDEFEFSRPPKRARRRYVVRYLLAVLSLTGVFAAIAQVLGNFTLWFTPLLLVPLVPVAAHLKWTHLGYDAGEEYFVVRSGFWRQTIRVVPYYRLQTVVRERSVFQRRLGLAHLTADTATSSLLGRRDATAFDIDDDEARRLYTHNRDRLQASLGLRQ
ncbi:PH domain-containing protein [Halorientalis salina]|uniref:PH domain-containing protein n=1 Tax=Halorientalis salina TaxID=2932266 RepID=UPI0010AD0DF0|nr:PH domain-containing protein [Halorientalis salina]